MIIQSLLDTDLYKFTMMQVVLHHFPGAHVEYRFNCRTRGVDLAPYVGASLEVMDHDAKKMRGKKPFVFSNLKTGKGVDEIVAFIKHQGMLGSP